MTDAARIANTLAGMNTGGGWEGRAGNWDPRRARQRPSFANRLRTLREASDYTRRVVGIYSGVPNITPELWAEALDILAARVTPRTS